MGDLSMTDLLGYDRLGDFAPSPTHDRVAVVVQGDEERLAMLRLDGDLAELTPLPDAPVGVNRIVWHPNGERLLATLDPIGAENHQVAELDANTGAVLWSTDRPAASHLIGPIMDNHPRSYRPDGAAVAYSGNVQDPANSDVIVRDLATGVETIVFHGDDRYTPVAWSPDGQQLLVKQAYLNSQHDLFVCRPDTGETRQLTPGRLAARYRNAGWTADGNHIVLLTDLGRDLLAPALLDVATGDLRWIAEPDREVVGLALAPDGRHVAWGHISDGQSHWFVDDLATGRRTPVRSLPAGVISSELGANGHFAAHLDQHGEHLITRCDLPIAPTELYRIDLTADSPRTGARRLTDMGASLAAQRLIGPSYVQIRNRDGLTMHTQVYRPTQANAGPVPVVVMVHGGPESAHTHEYMPDIQGLLRAGIGVVAPDIRGSTGYGRAFQRLGLRAWGEGDVRDVLDCVDHLRTLPWVDSTRLGIMGGSYGGYLTLACITQDPDLWRAAVDIFGPSDLVLDADSVPPMWQHRVADWIGDTSDPVDRARLVDHSPIHYAEKITTPLLVVQGALDVRVTPEQSSNIVDKLRGLGRTVELIELADEGHGFASRANFDRVYRAAVEWLHAHLTS